MGGLYKAGTDAGLRPSASATFFLGTFYTFLSIKQPWFQHYKDHGQELSASIFLAWPLASGKFT